MKRLAMVFLFLLPLVAEARKPGETRWYTGQMVLMNNQMIDCELSYDAYTDLIQVQENNRVKVYSARQVKSFVYYDSENNAHRHFVSLLYGSRFRVSWLFFERVLGGEMNLLRRYRSVKLAQQSKTAKEELWYDSRKVYDYFIYNDKGFIPFYRFRKAVLGQMMAEYKEPLQDFIRSRNLDMSTQRGQFMVISQYNTLKDPEKLGLF